MDAIGAALYFEVFRPAGLEHAPVGGGVDRYAGSHPHLRVVPVRRRSALCAREGAVGR